jgi:hypothetical protein
MPTRDSRARNSRWGDAPTIGKDGRAKLAVVTERDIERIFAPLARYRYLPADYLQALGGGSLDYLINRLSLLARKPNSYVARPQQQRANANANCRRQVYELAEKGVRLMHERALICQRSRAPASFAHELMTCELMASFELGVREARQRLIWSTVAASSPMRSGWQSGSTCTPVPILMFLVRAAMAAAIVSGTAHTERSGATWISASHIASSPHFSAASTCANDSAKAASWLVPAGH